MAMPKVILSLSHTPPPKTHTHPTFPSSSDPTHTFFSRRTLILTAFTSSSLVPLSSAVALPEQPPPPPQSSSNSPNSFLSGIANTKSWFQFYGDGFAIRVPPDFEDINEPEACFFLFPRDSVSCYSLFEGINCGLSSWIFLRPMLLEFCFFISVLAFQNLVWIVVMLVEGTENNDMWIA